MITPGSGIGVWTEHTSVNSEDDCCAISGDGGGLWPQTFIILSLCMLSPPRLHPPSDPWCNSLKTRPNTLYPPTRLNKNTLNEIMKKRESARERVTEGNSHSIAWFMESKWCLGLISLGRRVINKKLWVSAMLCIYSEGHGDIAGGSIATVSQDGRCLGEVNDNNKIIC